MMGQCQMSQYRLHKAGNTDFWSWYRSFHHRRGRWEPTYLVEAGRPTFKQFEALKRAPVKSRKTRLYSYLGASDSPLHYIVKMLVCVVYINNYKGAFWDIVTYNIIRRTKIRKISGKADPSINKFINSIGSLRVHSRRCRSGLLRSDRVITDFCWAG